MNNNIVRITLSEVYDRIKCQQFVPDSVLREFNAAVLGYSGTPDYAVTEMWLVYIKNISQDALMLRTEKDRDHFSFVHDALCDALAAYLSQRS